MMQSLFLIGGVLASIASAEVRVVVSDSEFSDLASCQAKAGVSVDIADGWSGNAKLFYCVYDSNGADLHRDLAVDIYDPVTREAEGFSDTITQTYNKFDHFFLLKNVFKNFQEAEDASYRGKKWLIEVTDGVTGDSFASFDGITIGLPETEVVSVTLRATQPSKQTDCKKSSSSSELAQSDRFFICARYNWMLISGEANIYGGITGETGAYGLVPYNRDNKLNYHIPTDFHFVEVIKADLIDDGVTGSLTVDVTAKVNLVGNSDIPQMSVSFVGLVSTEQSLTTGEEEWGML